MKGTTQGFEHCSNKHRWVCLKWKTYMEPKTKPGWDGKTYLVCLWPGCILVFLFSQKPRFYPSRLPSHGGLTNPWVFCHDFKGEMKLYAWLSKETSPWKIQIVFNVPIYPRSHYIPRSYSPPYCWWIKPIISHCLDWFKPYLSPAVIFPVY